jgi:hypothetical protein
MNTTPTKVSHKSTSTATANDDERVGGVIGQKATDKLRHVGLVQINNYIIDESPYIFNKEPIFRYGDWRNTTFDLNPYIHIF